MLSSAGVTDTAPQLTGAPAADKVAMSEEARDEPREGEGASTGTPYSPEGGSVPKTSPEESELDGATELPPITFDGPALSHLSKGAKNIPT